MALLEQASMYIHLDPRADAVKVPAWFKKQPQLVLQVGLNMAVPIPDLHVDDQGLSCTLSFNRSPFYCMIPWPAVFALVGENGQAMVWAEDVPAEVAAQAQAQKPPEKPRNHLRSVGEGESAPAAKVDAAKAPDKKAASKASRPGRPAATKAAAEKPRAKVKTEPKAAPKTAKPAATKAAKVPTEAKATAKRPASEPRPAPEPTNGQKTPAQAKPEAARAVTEGSKPKRELPSYLRVVK